MGNGIKKFLQNKNTVTVIGVVAAVLVLYIGYNIRVNRAVNPITVPYAKETIKAGTQIKAEQVGTIQVPPSMIHGDVLTNQAQIIDKFARPDSIIPEGSLFYASAVVEESGVPWSIILQYPKGYVLYNMNVTTASTYGNSIYPGNYIDIYLRISRTGNRAEVQVGRFIENVKVLAVKDANGQAVFANIDEQRTPSMIVFALPEEDYISLKKAEKLVGYSAEIIPVPTNESLETTPGEIKTSDQIKKFIADNSPDIWMGETNENKNDNNKNANDATKAN